ncbi:capsular polysaccharide biosynthesis protein [Chachezhania antarctica]|uniref:capsular polysaccharide biosynthesis protein n=1 Tax=Chachezhania antarctica TaxID=2340860 RepID=UPI000EB20FE6|nr:capsular polysaccharide biosynthesis protein [Chachezhania antarctica]
MPALSGHPAGRFLVYNGGFLTQPRVRRILALAGLPPQIGLPRPGDSIGLWGASPTAWRGEAMARRYDAPLIRVEDAFLRSLHPGRARSGPPLGLVVDRTGLHFDTARPSDLETLLATRPLDDPALMDRARDGIRRMREGHLSKYTAFDPALPAPDPGYILVIDQTHGDASVRLSGAGPDRFREMLAAARRAHPEAPIVIRTHPETRTGHRSGHFDPAALPENVTLHGAPVSPWRLLDGAAAVYTVSSQLGFEAILSGHRPHVFGQPFYAGWGLTEDAFPMPRRTRRLTAEQLFAAAMILYPLWYDPFHDRLCDLDTALDAFEAETRAWRDDHRGWIASGMRLWKRRPLNAMFGGQKKVIFTDDPARAERLATSTGRRRMIWAGKADADDRSVRVEDGFLRSRGLGAELVPPLSLVLDEDGIYYDPTRPSALETWIARRADLTPPQRQRAERLIARLTDLGLSKYNIGAPPPDLPEGHRILVPGQVEDDASIRLGTDAIRTNRALLEAARKANPAAVLIYKPHPDVEAGLRPGALDAAALADIVLAGIDPARLLPHVNEVWTMTSALGFEALLRGLPVTTLGAPFYAGWGLTTDLGDVPARRKAAFGSRRIDIATLAHAALIDYPRYRDPVTGRPCPAEIIVDRLADGQIPRPGALNRSLAKVQGALSSHAWIWR